MQRTRISKAAIAAVTAPRNSWRDTSQSVWDLSRHELEEAATNAGVAVASEELCPSLDAIKRGVVEIGYMGVQQCILTGEKRLVKS